MVGPRCVVAAAVFVVASSAWAVPPPGRRAAVVTTTTTTTQKLPKRAPRVLVSQATVDAWDLELRTRSRAYSPVASQWAIFGGVIGGGTAVLARCVHPVAASMYASTIAASTAVSLVFNYFSGGAGHRVARSLGGVPAGAALTTLVSDLARRAGVAVDGVYELRTAEPNAFAAGRKSKAVVAVTTGLVNTLSRDELEAVVAHELGHIRHADVGRALQQAAMLQGLAATFHLGWSLMQRHRRPELFRRRPGDPRRRSEDDDDDDEGGGVEDLPRVLGVAIASVGALSYAAGSLIRLGASRSAELGADTFAARLTSPRAMAAALAKIDRSAAPRDTLDSTAFAHLYIANDGRRDVLARVSTLFRTHPTTKERIKRLLDDESNSKNDLTRRQPPPEIVTRALDALDTALL